MLLFWTDLFQVWGRDPVWRKSALPCHDCLLVAKYYEGELVLTGNLCSGIPHILRGSGTELEWHQTSHKQDCSISILLADLCRLSQLSDCRSLCDEPLLSGNDGFASLNSSIPPSKDPISFLVSVLSLCFSSKLWGSSLLYPACPSPNFGLVFPTASHWY